MLKNITTHIESRQLLVNQAYIGWRFDAAIADLLPEYSRAKISMWIKNSQVKMNNAIILGKTRIKQTGTINITIDSSPAYSWHAQNIALNVVYEDRDIIVINKPAGLVTHPGAGNMHGTLANGLLYFDPNLDKLDRVGIVHRLDKDTSGLLVVARSQLAQKSLISQLQNHTIVREYNAIVYGHLIAGGSIDEPIGRHPKDRIKQAVIKTGKQAITHYRIIERFKHHTLVKVILETGRTHQIRVHLSHIRHGLIADKQYGKGLSLPKGADDMLKEGLKNMPRHCLHAKKLSIIHPNTNEELSWQVELPEDMNKLLTVLRKYDCIN